MNMVFGSAGAMFGGELINKFGSLGIAVRHPNILRFRKRRRNHGFDGSNTD
jgi:hypothetical protein